jgi:hypothetical protein
MPSPNCPDCDEAMAEGFVIDMGHYNQPGLSTWHPGKPTQKKFLGIEAGLDVKSTARATVSAFRCPRCGLLRLYAKAKVFRKVT